MTEKDKEYISIIWHELRTPLSSLRWYLSMILEGDMGEISPEARKALNHCYDSSIRMIKLSNDILTLSKIEAGKMEYYPESISIPHFLESVHKDVFIEVEDKWITLEIQVDKNLKEKYLFLDKDRLKQVFLNFIGNAIKFTDIWWKIIVKASKKKQKVLFEIIDNGIGIPEGKREDLFKKFSQVKGSLQRNNKQWLGLWLALCKHFLKDFNSKIELESEVGKGSNFSFELKLTEVH